MGRRDPAELVEAAGRGDRSAIVRLISIVERTGAALGGGVSMRRRGTRGKLRGLSRATTEAIRVLDAAGYRLVRVDSVGVGRVEVDSAGSAASTVVGLDRGSGDAVQAAKAGLL